MKTFLICPVRGHDPAETATIVAGLEGQGYQVHWSPRDTDQDDETGLRICRDNRAAIEAADAVHVVWDGVSQGCLFDLGMAFAMGKPIIPIQLPPWSEGKSFQNMVRAQYDETAAQPESSRPSRMFRGLGVVETVRFYRMAQGAWRKRRERRLA